MKFESKNPHPDPRPLPPGFEPEDIDLGGVDPCPIDLIQARKAFYQLTEQLGPAEPRRGCLVWKGPYYRRDKYQIPRFCFHQQEWPARRFIYLVECGPVGPKDRFHAKCRYHDCVSVFHVERRQPRVYKLQRKTRLTAKEQLAFLYLLRRGASVPALALKHNIDPALLRTLKDEIEHGEAPKRVTGVMRLRIKAMLDRQCDLQEIVSELSVNAATVVSVREELFGW